LGSVQGVKKHYRSVLLSRNGGKSEGIPDDERQSRWERIVADNAGVFGSVYFGE